MATDHSPIPVVFFHEDPSGNEPVKRWLLELDKESRKKIGEDLRVVQLRWPLGMPLIRNMGVGFWELRSHIPKGIARVLFKIIKGEIILLHGFIKKTQKTPQEDIQLAQQRARKYERQRNEK